MTDFALLTVPADWQPAYRRRLIDSYRAGGLPEPAATELAAKTVELSGSWTAASILDGDGRRIGQVVVGLTEQSGRSVGRIGELWTDPGRDEQGRHRRAAHAWALRWCAEHGAGQVVVRQTAPDRLFAEYPVRGQTRIKPVGAGAGVGPGAGAGAGAEPPTAMTYRPMTHAEYPVWKAAGTQRYAADMVRAGSWTPEQARERAEEDYRALLPEGVATPGNTLLVLQSDGEPIGNAWLKHGFLSGVTFGYSLVVHPEFRGRGHGRAAMTVGEQVTRAAGDQVLMLNVFGGNEVAMSLYTAVGYRVLEETRSCDLTPDAGRRPASRPLLPPDPM
ncbi:Ribosomal protein S18 acetylase RimI [Streptomyces sp. DvalAA-14]|uniref:GNAT family N-acetyltransferase n=1 Tax=unclassified Streptomyces TaxID=2593676 RepID=UPI00081B5FDD|nr:MULTISPECIES: GNAT family N-acetyltransferase [unclassified Streptomyces]MYS22162.1 GNAT family N-acetyltransferase [Streptomyces sp. SID4948]SCE09943.1 Ribosomal protein S18 acetylase RimI [Streptomyces sp. DvalAA-14]